jgi:predicted AAA+ superfamily ATPase
MLPRLLVEHLAAVAGHGKMAFVSGPRQVGKTTLARAFQKRFAQSAYFNWDVITDQKRLLKDPYFFEREDRDPGKPFLVVFDEIHKYARWKNYLKGAYDAHRRDFRFLVTGSGRLDLFKKGGDSLLGRYLSAPLFPLTVGELGGRRPTWEEFKAGLGAAPAATPGGADAYAALFRYSGFPEPFVKADTRFYNAWFQERKTLLVREDIRNASAIREISLMETLSHLVPEKVGAPLSVNALKEDVGVAFETVRDWLLLLEQFYYMFRVAPYAGSLARTLRKEAKAYLYDWVEVPAEGLRFENMVALHLHKAVQTWRATGEGDLGLHYVRDKEKREVDFLLTERRRPVCLVECKFSDTQFSPALSYYQAALEVPTAVQLVHGPGICRKTTRNGARQWVISADRWLAALP